MEKHLIGLPPRDVVPTVPLSLLITLFLLNLTMNHSLSARLVPCLASVFFFAGCSDGGAPGGTGGATSGTGATSGDGSVGGATQNGSDGGSGSGGRANNGGGSNTGGTQTGDGGGSTGDGGTTSDGGTSAGGSGGDTSSGGNGGSNGGTSSGGTDGSGGADVDAQGKSNAVPGESTSEAQDYLRLGDIRLLNNNWGSAERGCDTQMSVFVNDDSSFGWDFNRGACGGMGSQPDFPQAEFGIHPFGIGSDLATSPEFSSTTVLPLQIKDITSSSVTVDNLNISLQNASSWNIVMEFWLSERDPVNDPDPGVYAEVMAWWGWNNGRWPCDSNNDGYEDFDGDKVQAGMQYTLCHQDDSWADGQWRYYQFRAGDGSDANISHSFNGTIDVKSFLDYLVNNRGYSQDLWVTRLEVGSEIDDNTSGSVTMNGLTFEVNGESRSEVIGTP